MNQINKYNCEDTAAINRIERECNKVYDARNNQKNARISIYEVIANKEYLMIYKQNGIILKTVCAQNQITIHLHGHSQFN